MIFRKSDRLNQLEYKFSSQVILTGLERCGTKVALALKTTLHTTALLFIFWQQLGHEQKLILYAFNVLDELCCVNLRLVCPIMQD